MNNEQKQAKLYLLQLLEEMKGKVSNGDLNTNELKDYFLDFETNLDFINE